MKYYKMSNLDDLMQAAFRSAPWHFRLLGLSLPSATVEAQCAGIPEWEELKTELKPDDKLWPFHFNRNTLAMRKGFLVVRHGKPHGVVVTELS